MVNPSLNNSYGSAWIFNPCSNIDFAFSYFNKAKFISEQKKYNSAILGF